jgi:hypothetical protein
MPKAQISLQDWRLIVQRINERMCVPILGAGVNVSNADYQGLPLGPELTMCLVGELIGKPVADLKDLAEVTARNQLLKKNVDLARLGVENLARVALHVMQSYDYQYLMKQLRTVLPDQERQPSQLLRTLARLPFRLIVTTNYDRLMERALDEAGRKYLTVVQPIDGFREPEQIQLRDQLADWGDKLILYKIHGSFRDDQQSSRRVIITEEDYIEFLTVVGIVDKGVPKKIQMELTTSALLFLGYSLEDWDFRTIFKGLIEKLDRHQQLKSYAIQWNPAKFWAELWESKRVVVYHQDVHRFGRLLDKKYSVYVKQLARQGGDGSR